MILILSPELAAPAQSVAAHLRPQGIEHAFLDLSLYPQRASLSLHEQADKGQMIWREAARSLDLGRVRAVWTCQRMAFQFETGLAGADFAARACEAAFAGLWQGLQAGWMNPPQAAEAAARPGWQLALARDLQLEPPATLMTNDPAEAEAFLAQFPQCVYRPFGAPPSVARPFGASERAMLDHLRHAPLILQQALAGPELTLVTVGDRVFSALWPGSSRNQTLPYELPSGIEDAVRAMMGRMGLIFGVMTMRLDPRSGLPRFIALDPAGEWWVVEQQTQAPIARTMADQLMRMAQDGMH